MSWFSLTFISTFLFLTLVQSPFGMERTFKRSRVESAADPLTVTYYNVGQGNCMLLENPSKRQIVLVDCGSTENNDKIRASHNKPIIDQEEIIRDIRKKIGKFDDNPVVIITHKDGDHYNLLPNIFDTNDSAGYKGKPPHVIVSVGELSLKEEIQGHSKGSFATLYQWLYPESKKTDTDEEEEEGENIKISSPPPKVTEIKEEVELASTLKRLGLTEWLQPITAVAGKEEGVSETGGLQPNADSIVLKAVSGKCSTLLTGDANKVTANHILRGKEDEQQVDSLLNTTILLSLHHGAITHGSNDPWWASETSPQVVIISAGHNEQYGHPRCIMLAHYLNPSYAPRLIKESPAHSLTCHIGFMEFPKALPFNLEERKFPFEGNEAIYSTFDQGTMRVNFQNDSFKLSNIMPNEDTKELEVKTLIEEECQ